MEILKLQDILKRYDINRPAFWRWRKNLGFPAPITPSNTRPIWRLADIETWEDNNFCQNQSVDLYQSVS